MLQVGIFNGYYPLGLEDTVKKLKEDGFSCVQLDLSFKDMDLAPGMLTKEKCRRIRNTFRDANIQIVGISGDTNMVCPDLDQRKKNLDGLKEKIKFAHDLGCSYVISEVGSFNPDSDWIDCPKNNSEAGYEELCGIILDVVQYAYDHGAVYLVETYINHVVKDVETVLRLFADINHTALGHLIDPTNYFGLHNIDHMDRELNRMFNALGNKIKIAHAKDCLKTAEAVVKRSNLDADEGHNFRGSGGIDLPAPGLGSLNYDLYLERLYRIDPNMPLIIEHVDDGDIPRAKKFVDDKLKQTGC